VRVHFVSLNAPSCGISFPRPVDREDKHNDEERDQKYKEPDNDQGP